MRFYRMGMEYGGRVHRSKIRILTVKNEKPHFGFVAWIRLWFTIKKSFTQRQANESAVMSI